MKRLFIVSGIAIIASMFSARHAGGQQPAIAAPATPAAQRTLL